MNVVVTALLAAAIALPSGSGSSETDRTKARLDQGEVVINTFKVRGSEYPKVVAMGVIDTSVEKVWAVVDDCKNYRKTLTNVKFSAELERKGRKSRCKMIISVPLLPDLTSVTDATRTVTKGKKYVHAWTLVDGDYDKNDGAWTVVPFKGPNRTLLMYSVHLEPKIRVPAAIQKIALRKSLPKLFTKLRSVLTGKKP